MTTPTNIVPPASARGELRTGARRLLAQASLAVEVLGNLALSRERFLLTSGGLAGQGTLRTFNDLADAEIAADGVKTRFTCKM
ncbi:hypothetical protein [Methylobacterium nodulans]|uniref:hypothetical protein n=1 Tax=Methylobacterium nodulans TaxID=114616 RepID=UPI0012EDBF85|nr:hypothetical protein [Methylobacterium nodulans]